MCYLIRVKTYLQLQTDRNQNLDTYISDHISYQVLNTNIFLDSLDRDVDKKDAIQCTRLKLLARVK